MEVEVETFAGLGWLIRIAFWKPNSEADLVRRVLSTIICQLVH